MTSGNMSQGRLFYIAFPENEHPDFVIDDVNLSIFISSVFNTNVTLTGPDGTVISDSIFSGETKSFDLTNFTDFNWEVDECEQIIQKSIKITSEKPVSVYGMNIKQYSSDGFMAIPVKSWGNEYFHCAFYDFSNYPSGRFPRGGGFIIIASEDNTDCKIIFKSVNNASGDTFKGRKPGDTIVIAMNAGHVYNVRSQGFERGEFDLSGSHIISNKPVGLISYHMRTAIPSWSRHIDGRDHLIEMIPPVSAWGKNFHTGQYNRKEQGDFFRLMASKKNTNWSVKWYDQNTGEMIGNESGNLKNPGEIFEYLIEDVKGDGSDRFKSIRGNSVWNADKPVMLMQYSYSSDWDAARDFDPFMIVAAPDEQFIKSSIFQTPADNYGFDDNRLNLIFDATELNKSEIMQVRFDGKLLSELINDTDLINFPDNRFYKLSINIPPGNHELRGSVPFSGQIFGFSEYNSYGWPAAMALKNISDTSDIDYPKYNYSMDCGAIDIVVTDSSGLWSDGNDYYIDYGIDFIGLMPESRNMIMIPDFVDFSGDEESGVFEFSIISEDKYSEGIAVFQVSDKNGNTIIDSIAYSPESLMNVEFQVGNYPKNQDLPPGGFLNIPVRLVSDEWEKEEVTSVSLNMIYGINKMVWQEEIRKGENLPEDWEVFAEEFRSGDNHVLKIEASGQTALKSDVTIASAKFLVFLSDSIKFNYKTDNATLVHRDSCILKEHKNGVIEIFTCARDLRLIKIDENMFYIEILNGPDVYNILSVKFGIPKEAYTRIEIFNEMGTHVKTLIDKILKKGIYTRNFNIDQELASGVYHLRLISGNQKTSTKFLIIR